MLRLALTCVALLVIAVPSRGQTAVEPDTKELQSYRLTLPALKQFVAVMRNVAAAAKSDARFGRMTKLRAELDQLQEKEELTEADEARLEKLHEELEAAEDSFGGGFNMSEHKTLSDMEAALRKEPLMMNALQSAGMTPRDYAKFALAFFQAAMIHGMQKSGMIKEIPKELQASVNMDNIKFVEAHEAEIKALMAEMQALGKG